MKRMLIVAAIGVTVLPTLALGAGLIPGRMSTAAAVPALPNFGKVTTAFTLATPGLGKGGFTYDHGVTLPMLGSFGATAYNTGKGGAYVVQYYHQSPSAIAAGDALPPADPAPSGGDSKLPPIAIDYQRVGSGFGGGQPLPLPPVYLPAGLGVGQLTLSNEGADGRSTIAAHYSTH